MFNFAEKTIDMSAVEILNYYRNLYYAEPQVTERGIVANAINDVLPMAIFLPCKMGQTVYALYAGIQKVFEMQVTSVRANSAKTLIYLNSFDNTYMWAVCLEEFGKTFFLTEEEAEAALKERNNHE